MFFWKEKIKTISSGLILGTTVKFFVLWNKFLGITHVFLFPQRPSHWPHLQAFQFQPSLCHYIKSSRISKAIPLLITWTCLLSVQLLFPRSWLLSALRKSIPRGTNGLWTSQGLNPPSFFFWDSRCQIHS